MDRLRVSVCSTAIILLLTLAHSSMGTTRSKSTPNRRQTAIRAARATSGARFRDPKTIKGCAPCAAELAQKGKGRATKKGAKTAKKLPCHPKDYIDPKIARNYNTAMRDMRRAGIKPRVTSVWRSSESQAQLHRCSLSTRCRRSNPGLYRALPAGKSIHEAGFAVDMAGIATGPRGDKRLTPQGKRIVAIMKKNGFNWRYGLADPVHFEADPKKHGYRSVQEAITRTQTTCQVKLAKNKAHKKPANRVAARAPGKPRLSADASPTKHRRRNAKASA